MDEQLSKLMEEYKDLNFQQKKIAADMRKKRREINERLEQLEYGLLCVPYYREWKERGNF